LLSSRIEEAVVPRMRARYHTLAYSAFAAVGVACTSFTPDDAAPPQPPAGQSQDPITSPRAADAGVVGTSGDAALAWGADAAACTPISLIEHFETSETPSGWQRVLFGGGAVGFVPDGSPSFALHASGTFATTGTSRALLRTKLPAAVKDVDLDYRMRFDPMVYDAEVDAGCMLELARADNASVRAWIAVGFGIAGGPNGIDAHVEVMPNGSTAPMLQGSAVRPLATQLSTQAWYSVHVKAVVGADDVRVDFDLNGAISASVPALTVPFRGVEAIVLSCGVDNALGDPSGAGKPYGLDIDDVVLRACP
jgi:hypothetical protein